MEHVTEYVKKLFLSVYWVCKWRKGVREHLQTCLQAPGTIPMHDHGQIHYILQWISAKKNESMVFGTLKKTLLHVCSTTSAPNMNTELQELREISLFS